MAAQQQQPFGAQPFGAQPLGAPAFGAPAFGGPAFGAPGAPAFGGPAFGAPITVNVDAGLARAVAVSMQQQLEPDPGLQAMLEEGNLQLTCSNGSVKVSREILSLASPFFKDMLQDTSETKDTSEIKVLDTTKQQWYKILAQLYPVFPRPTLGLNDIYQILPAVHKYNIAGLLGVMEQQLLTQLPAAWSILHTAPGYMLKWLITAESLHLDKLKASVLTGLQQHKLCTAFRTSLKAKQLDTDLNKLSPGTLIVVLHATHDNTPCWCTRACNCSAHLPFGAGVSQADGPCGCGSNLNVCKQCRGAMR